jgi:hypothetical protein
MPKPDHGINLEELAAFNAAMQPLSATSSPAAGSQARPWRARPLGWFGATNNKDGGTDRPRLAGSLMGKKVILTCPGASSAHRHSVVERLFQATPALKLPFARS